MEGMVGRTKSQGLISGDCELKDYMQQKSLKDVRDTFRTRVQLVEGIKGNFKNRYREEDRCCNGCEVAEDTQPHVLICEAYSDLREGKYLKRDADMVEYFREVLARRMVD